MSNRWRLMSCSIIAIEPRFCPGSKAKSLNGEINIRATISCRIVLPIFCRERAKARRFGKKFHAREARREAKRVLRAALLDVPGELAIPNEVDNYIYLTYEEEFDSWEDEYTEYDVYLCEEDERSKTDWLNDPFEDVTYDWDY